MEAHSLLGHAPGRAPGLAVPLLHAHDTRSDLNEPGGCQRWLGASGSPGGAARGRRGVWLYCDESAVISHSQPGGRRLQAEPWQPMHGAARRQQAACLYAMRPCSGFD